MAAVQESDYYRLVIERERGLVRLERKAAPFPSLSEMARVNGELRASLEEARGLSLLIDFRQGPPGRNDPPFEAATEEARRRLQSGFSRVAVLVRSVAGKLQVQRLARAENRDARVFLDEAEALAYLAQGRTP